MLPPRAPHKVLCQPALTCPQKKSQNILLFCDLPESSGNGYSGKFAINHLHTLLHIGKFLCGACHKIGRNILIQPVFHAGKQSQLVLIAEVQYVNAGEAAGTDVRDHMGKIINNVNNGMTSRVGNMFFQQYGLDIDRADREKRLDDINNKVNDETKGYR